MRPETTQLALQLAMIWFMTAVGAPVELRAQTKLPKQSQAPVRRWLPAPTLVRTFVGPAGDELLMPSSLVATANGGLALFDFGAMELRAFSVEGHPLWRAGRKGAGPGEFRNAMDVKVRPNGDITVLDMGNRRITALSRTGRLLRTIPLRFSSSRFIPLADTTRVGLTSEDSGAFWSAVNLRGDVVERGIAPPSIALQHSLAKETFTTRFGTGAVVTFRWSDKFAILDANGTIVKLVDGIEPLPFPSIKSYPMKVGRFTGQVSRINPQATPGALSVASDGVQIFILFAGATVDRGRIVDVYDGQTGAYAGSQLLALPAQEIVTLPNNTFATLRSDPIPSVDVWNASAAKAAARLRATTERTAPNPTMSKGGAK